MTVDELLEMRNAIAAAQLLANGAFEKELKEIAGKKAELEKLYGFVPDLKAAKEARAAAQKELDASKQKAALHEKTMAEELQRVKGQQADLREKQEQLAQEIASAKQAKAAADKYKSDTDALHTARMQKLEERAKQLQESDARIAAERRTLDERVRRVSAAMS